MRHRLALAFVALGALTAALVTAAAAAAWSPPPNDDAARLALYLPIARAAWPGSPCAGRESVELDVDLGGAVGETQDGTCAVRMAGGRTAEGFCDTLVHELGHAAGYGHTDDPLAVHAPAGPQADIMRSSGGRWPACVAATTPTARYLADKYVRELLPRDGSGWQVSCTPMTDPRPRCRAAHGGARPRHFAIVVSDAGQVMWAEQNDGKRPATVLDGGGARGGVAGAATPGGSWRAVTGGRAR